MNKIIEKTHFSANVVKLVVEAPLIAKARRAGHFVIVRADEHGERIPLTIADSDTKAGTITLVVQAVGRSTRKICGKEVGDVLHDVVGPLGQATRIEKFGTVVCCGGGVGVAPLLPIIKAMKQAGNRVVSVLAGRTKDLIILEDEVRKWSDEVVIMTDVDTAVALCRDGHHGIPVPDYVDENVSTKVVKIIQSYVTIVNKTVWRKG